MFAATRILEGEQHMKKSTLKGTTRLGPKKLVVVAISSLNNITIHQLFWDTTQLSTIMKLALPILLISACLALPGSKSKTC